MEAVAVELMELGYETDADDEFVTDPPVPAENLTVLVLPVKLALTVMLPEGKTVKLLDVVEPEAAV